MMDPLPAHPATPGGSARERYSILLSRLLASGQWERVLDTARGWLAEDPETILAHRAAAQALINLQRYKLASPHLQKVLSLNPDDGFTCRLASIAYFHQGRYNRADECIQRAIHLQPEDAMHWYHLAWIRYRHGARGMALKYARRALGLAPNNPNIINLVALNERDEPEKRLAHYQRALELDPENAIVHNNVGAHYLHAGKDSSRAIEAFRQALVLNPTDKVAQANLLAALRDRDFIRRALQSPARLLLRLQRNLAGIFIMSWLSGIVLLPVGLLWLVFMWPLAGAYSFLLEHDVRARAGLIGTRRRGWLGFWRWPHWTRTGALFIVYTAAWASVIILVRRILPDVSLPDASELPPFL